MLAFAWLAATAWLRPLMLPDEGRYAGVAWEMLRSGDWLTPTLNGLPYFHKPPLFYWITAGSLATFGLHEWAARAASVLAATAGALAFYLFIRRWRDRRVARLGLLALLAQPLWTLGGQFANLDMLVAACISASIVLFAHAALCVAARLPYRRALAGAYLAAALGVLAKGLIGAVLPALVIVLWLALRREWRALRSLLWLPGVLLFLLVAAPWFIAMQSRHAEFLDYFFIVQHFKRFATAGFNNVMPFWFYPAALALLALPWWPWLPRAFRRGTASGGEPGALRTLMLTWLLAIVVFFSLPASKLIGYVLPAVPPLVYLLVDGFAAIAAPSRRQLQLWWAGAAFACAVSIAAVAVLALRGTNSSREIASALVAQRAAHEPVLMLGHYEFDLPFYAQLRRPVIVVDDWADPDIAHHDNWRKEIADAGHFDPRLAATLLLQPAALGAALCGAPVNWVIGAKAMQDTHAFLRESREIARDDHAVLWRVDTSWPSVARALGCRPSAPRGEPPL